MRKMLIVVAVIVLAVGVASAQVNRDRILPVVETTLSEIHTCDLPGTTYAKDGWDLNPPGGSWGGKPVSQIAVVWQKGTQDIPTNAGRFAQCTIPGVSGMTAKKIQLSILHGLANDSYCVFASIGAGDLLVACYTETSVSEVWSLDEFDLPAGVFAPGQDITIKILAAGNAWGSFSTWGQLAVDYIKILGE